MLVKKEKTEDVATMYVITMTRDEADRVINFLTCALIAPIKHPFVTDFMKEWLLRAYDGDKQEVKNTIDTMFLMMDRLAAVSSDWEE